MLVASGRSHRPNAHRPDPGIDIGNDPFLEGNEVDTPSERLALRNEDSLPNQPGWQVRVVPNRYPAVAVDQMARQTAANSVDGIGANAAATVSSHALTAPSELLPERPAHGVHDVVIECPDHRTSLLQLSQQEISEVLTAWKLRIRQLRNTGKFDGIAVFRNEGFSAGGSLAHCHSQIIATTELMPLQQACLQQAEQHQINTGRNLTEDWLLAEIRDGRRILNDNEGFVWLCPFASRTAWQVRCVPTTFPQYAFDQLDALRLSQIASTLSTMLQTMKTLLGEFSFNITVIHPPFSRPNAHPWMLDVLPRRGRIAGWELLTDVDIVTTSPEDCAAQLRRCLPAAARQRTSTETQAQQRNAKWTSECPDP